MKKQNPHAPRRVGTCAVDQFGNTYHNLGIHPRKSLLERLGRTRAEKMYIDTVDGGTRHIGYVIAGRWLTLYVLSEWSKQTEVAS